MFKARKNSNLPIFLIFFTIFATLISFSSQTFDAKKVKLIDFAFKSQKDSTNLNLLFRSNQPINSGKTQFKYSELIDAMKESAKANKIFLNTTKENYLIVYSLLSRSDKTNKIEEDYFKENNNKGEFINWPIVGTANNPEDYSSSDIKILSKSLSFLSEDNIDGLIDELYNTTRDFSMERNLLIVFHCTHGLLFNLLFFYFYYS